MSQDRIEAVQTTTPLVNVLPGETAPYYLASGEGQRHEVDGQLWTVIARRSDTGGLFEAAFILGPRGSSVPHHSLASHQRSYFVFDGSVQVWIGGDSRILVPGDSFHVPAGTPMSYRMMSHLTRLLFWSAPGGALTELMSSSDEVERHVYGTRSTTELILPAGSMLVDGDLGEAQEADDDRLPEGETGFFLKSRSGDRRAWPDAVNAYAIRGTNTGGKYFAVSTLSGPQPYIVRHFHRLHTENFFCLSGRVWIWANGEEHLLTAGDFFHAPAGTIHSFAVAAHNTQLLGLLTSDVFEPFFDVTGVTTADHVYTEGAISPAVVLEGISSHPELDLVVVGGPPDRLRAPGI